MSTINSTVQEASFSLNQKRANKWFMLFCSIHLSIWTLLPTLLIKTIPLDTAEGIVWGREWQWGYYKHPPLAAWLSNIAYQIQGSPGFSLYLLSQLAVILTFWAVWKFSLKLLTPLQALASILCLEGIYFYTFPSIQFNPDILMLPLWALLILKLYETLEKESLTGWISIGILAGLSVLAKYESFVLLIPIFIFMLINNQARKAFQFSGVYLAFIISLVIITPHLIWLYQNNFLPIGYALHSSQLLSNQEAQVNIHSFLTAHIKNLANYLFEQLIAVLPAFLLLMIFIKQPRQSHMLNKFQKQFLLIIICGPFLFTLLLSILLGIQIKTYWSIPYYSFFATLVLAFLRPFITLKIFKRYVLSCVFVFILFGLGSITALNYLPYKKGHALHLQFPAKKMAAYVTRIWHTHYHTKLSYLAGPKYMVDYVGAYARDHPSVLIDWNPHISPWINEQNLRKKGAIFIWPIQKGVHDVQLPPEIVKKFPRAHFKGTHYFAPLTQAHVPGVNMAYALLPPQKLLGNNHGI